MEAAAVAAASDEKSGLSLRVSEFGVSEAEPRAGLCSAAASSFMPRIRQHVVHYCWRNKCLADRIMRASTAPEHGRMCNLDGACNLHPRAADTKLAPSIRAPDKLSKEREFPDATIEGCATAQVKAEQGSDRKSQGVWSYANVAISRWRCARCSRSNDGTGM